MHQKRYRQRNELFCIVDPLSFSSSKQVRMTKWVFAFSRENEAQCNFFARKAIIRLFFLSLNSGPPAKQALIKFQTGSPFQPYYPATIFLQGDFRSNLTRALLRKEFRVNLCYEDKSSPPNPCCNNYIRLFFTQILS